MFKKILCGLMVLLFCFSSVSFSEDQAELDLSDFTEDYIIVVNAECPDQAVCNLEKNADEKCYPASTTKILSCIVALEKGDLDQYVKIPSSADSKNVKGSVMGLHKDEKFKLIDLLYGMMLPSGNDAAVAVAIGVSGKVSSFVDLMNEKAAEIGMAHSHFMNPNGLQNTDHYTTARDMAILAAYAMKNESFREIVACKSYRMVSKQGRAITVKTSNRFLRDYQSTTYKPESVLYSDAIGIKTGETNAAGKCLVAAAQRNDTVYIAVLLHGDMPSSSASLKKQDSYSVQRYKDARKLLEYAFDRDLYAVSLHDYPDSLIPRTFTKEYDPDLTGILSSTFRIEWNEEDSYTTPLYLFPDFMLPEHFSKDYLQISLEDETPSVDDTAGTASIIINEETYFTGIIVCDEIVTPTPSPTPSPTPLPTPTEVPVESPQIVIITPEPTLIPSSEEPAVTDAPSSWWLSCAPKA